MQEATDLPLDFQPINPQQEAQHALGLLLDKVYPIILSLGTLAIIASVFRITFQGWHPNILTDLFTFPFIILPVLFRKKLPLKYVIAIILSATSLNGISNFVTLGLATLSAVMLISNTGIICIAFGNRYGIWHAALCMAGIALIGTGIGFKVLPQPLVPPGYLSAPQTWVMQVVLFAFSAGMLLATVSTIQTRLTGIINHVIRQSAALEDSEHKYRLLAQNMNDALFQQDMELNITYASPSVFDMLGYTPEELYKLSIRDIMTPASLQKAGGMFAEYAAQAQTEDPDIPLMEFEYIRKDGSVFWGELHPIFLRDGHGRLSGSQGTLRDITDRKNAETALKGAVKDKEVLLRELHHRTKNNMQVIYSMLGMQAAGITDPKAAGILEDIQGRLLAMSLVHQKLYGTTDLSHINFAEYIRELFDLLLKSYRKTDTEITFDCAATDMEMTINTAVPCGLVLNELIMNSVKYAFTDRTDGRISISARQDAASAVTITYRDDGIGLPDGYDLRSADSLGFKIVFAIVEHQLGGSIDILSGPGFGCTITFCNAIENGAGNTDA